MSCANYGSARRLIDRAVRPRSMDLSLVQATVDCAAQSTDTFVDLCVASLACTNSVNYVFCENLCNMNAKFYKIKKTALLFYAKSISLHVIFTYYYTPPKPHFSTRGPDILT